MEVTIKSNYFKKSFYDYKNFYWGSSLIENGITVKTCEWLRFYKKEWFCLSGYFYFLYNGLEDYKLQLFVKVNCSSGKHNTQFVSEEWLMLHHKLWNNGMQNSWRTISTYYTAEKNLYYGDFYDWWCRES